MPDTEKATCKVRADVEVSRHTEATVSCGLEENHEEEWHFTKQSTRAIDKKTGKVNDASIIITWK